MIETDVLDYNSDLSDDERNNSCSEMVINNLKMSKSRKKRKINRPRELGSHKDNVQQLLRLISKMM